MTVIRWIAVFPAACLAAIAAALFAGFSLAMGHGFEFIGDLVAAPDMAGSYIVGTCCLLFIRGAMGAASTAAAVKIAPSHQRIVGFVSLGLLSAAMLGSLLVVNIVLERRNETLTFGEGWRAIVETAGLVGGSWFSTRDGSDTAIGVGGTAHDGVDTTAPNHSIWAPPVK